MTDDSVRGEDRYEDRYKGFPDGFFTRFDEDDDRRFYGEARLVQHIDDGAVAEVRDLYDEIGLYGEVLDLCSSWVSHLARTPQRLVVLGMNALELDRNPQAHERPDSVARLRATTVAAQAVCWLGSCRCRSEVGASLYGFSRDCAGRCGTRRGVFAPSALYLYLAIRLVTVG